jgi:single-stranded-DNA-specific exonuclease
MGCDIIRAITSQASLLQNFGGHPLAAGLSLESINIPDFQRGLNQAVEAQLGSGWREPPLTVDAYLPLSKLDFQFVAEIEKLAPFGPENPPLILASQDLLVQSIRAVGRGGEHRIVKLLDGTGGEFEAIWWQAASLPLPEGKIDLAYSVRSSDFRGQKTISIEWIESRESATSTIDVRKPKGRQIVDFRTFSISKWKLKEILAQGEVQVWREGEWIDTMPGRTRFELKPSNSLVIWSPPASISILRAAITHVHPSTVYLFNNPVGYSTVKDVLLAVSQHVKYALNHYGGKVELARLAARCGHREATISAALDWLAAKGIVRVLNLSALEYALVSPGQVDPMALQAAKLRIKALLEDTVAYREYYARAECEILLEKDIT